MEAANKEEPALPVNQFSEPARTSVSSPDNEDLEFSDVDEDYRKTKEDTVIEIIDEDPKAVLRAKSIKKATSPPLAAVEQVTDADEKIITVDQISDFSGLILPKGATFKIDEIKLHGRINAFEGTGTLPPDFDEIWKKNFSTAGFKDLDIDGDIGIETKKPKAIKKDSGCVTLQSNPIPTPKNTIPKIHGPLVDLSFKPQPGFEEMEMYPVNEPFRLHPDYLRSFNP